MNREALVITGLNPKMFCFSNEVSVSRGIKLMVENSLSDDLGMKTSIFESDWKRRGSLDKLRMDLFNQIEGINGEVVLIGLSAGMTASLIAKNKYPEKISKIISICGWTREDINLNNNERRKLDALRGPNPVFGQAVAAYTGIHDTLKESDWGNVFGMWTRLDEFVLKSCCVHEGMGEVRELKGVEHVGGILLGLTKTKEMREFI